MQGKKIIFVFASSIFTRGKLLSQNLNNWTGNVAVSFKSHGWISSPRSCRLNVCWTLTLGIFFSFI